MSAKKSAKAESPDTVVHERTRFVVTNKHWQAIEKAMSAPAKVLPNLQKKLSQPDEWDQQY